MTKNLARKIAWVVPLFCLLVMAAIPVSHAQSWRLDMSSPTGPIARVDIKFNEPLRGAVFIVFEYARNCDPMMSKLTHTSRALGRPITKQAIQPQMVYLLIDGRPYTWFGGEIVYENGREVAVGLVNEIFFELLTGRVSTLNFVDVDGESVSVPTSNFSRAVGQAFEACKRAVVK